jgi:ketosteroid isomerase-like protein
MPVRPGGGLCAADDALRSALVRADTAALARLYADDLLAINYRGVRSTKAGLLRAVGGGALRFDTLVVRRRAAEVRGDTGVVTGRMHQVARGPEGAHPREVAYVRVYVRHAGRWRLARVTLRAVDQPPSESLQPTEARGTLCASRAPTPRLRRYARALGSRPRLGILARSLTHRPYARAICTGHMHGPYARAIRKRDVPSGTAQRVAGRSAAVGRRL